MLTAPHVTNLHSAVSASKANERVIVAQSCPTLFDSMDCSPPGSSVHGISLARILGKSSGLPFPSPASKAKELINEWPRGRILKEFG